MSSARRCRQFFIPVLLAIVVSFGLLSCTKRFVGVSVDTNKVYWCRHYIYPNTCTYEDQWFMWNYTLSRGEEENEFILQGTADGTMGGAKSIGSLVPSESNFYLILSKNNIVVDSIVFNLPPVKVTSKIPFKKRFKCEVEFDSSSIWWEASVRG